MYEKFWRLIIKKLLKKVDYVFHFAGVADINQANKTPLKAINDNILGTANVLEACIHNKIKRFFFVVTSAQSSPTPNEILFFLWNSPPMLEKYFFITSNSDIFLIGVSLK